MIDPVRVLVIYDSRGTTRELAQAVLAGVGEEPGAEAVERPVEEAIRADLLACDALILGSPNWSGMTGRLKGWLDYTGDLWETGELAGVDWVFDAWGDQGGAFARDALIAEFVLEQAGATRVPSLLVNEGGAIHVDGEGTVMVTETVQLDPGRNRYATKERVEAELARTLGVTQTLWLPRGPSPWL